MDKELKNQTVAPFSSGGPIQGSFSTTLPTAHEVHFKLKEFSDFITNSYTLPLLNCTEDQKMVLLLDLVNINRNLTSSIELFQKGIGKKGYQFECASCKEEITINRDQNVWNSLQDHEHFDDLYYQFLNHSPTAVDDQLIAKLDQVTLEHKENVPKVKNTFFNKDSVCSSNSTNSNSKIINKNGQCSNARQIQKGHLKNDDNEDEDVNSFRFNFNIQYENIVDQKIYPESFMLGVSKYDKIKQHTMMVAGSCKVVCFICNCEMNGKRVHKNLFVNHAMGQKHLRAASDSEVEKILKNFHEFWLKQEVPIQAHQVYFRPVFLTQILCALCNKLYEYNTVLGHILSTKHKKSIIRIAPNNAYHLIPLQLELYGIETDNNNSLVEPPKNNEPNTSNGRELAPIRHNVITSVPNNHPTCTAIERLPNRMKYFRSFLVPPGDKRLNGRIYCKICKLYFSNNVMDLKYHCIEAHQRNYKYNYYCYICDRTLSNEEVWMKHKCAQKKPDCVEYECTRCKLVFYGDNQSVKMHLALKEAPVKLLSPPEPLRLPECVKRLLHSKKHVLLEVANLKTAADNVMKNPLTIDCCISFKSALDESFNDCKVYPFGSRVTGLGNNNSDLDVFIDVGDMYYGKNLQDPADQVIIVRKVQRILKQQKNEYAKFNPVVAARTPILKLYHIPTKIECDLSFKHGLSVENTKFLRLCMALQPKCQELILFVKNWAQQIFFDRITTYAFAIMCIFYLQLENYLPSVKKLRELNGAQHPTIGGWTTINYIFSPDEIHLFDVKPYPKSIDELIVDFFTYYSAFKFDTFVICPLMSLLVHRSLFDNSAFLSTEMNEYSLQLKTENGELFKLSAFACIQDPFDLSHNLTKAVNKDTFIKFQTMCKLSLEHIAKWN